MPGDLVDNRGKGVAGWSWPPIHSEGRKFALLTGFASAAAGFLAWETIAWPLAFLTLGVLAFFRDPQRAVPQDNRAILAPADGMITLIQKVAPPPELRAGEGGAGGMGEVPLTRISIFMSVFDVHINRAPVAGTVRRVVYIPGKFVNADLDKASEDNERQHFVVESADGTKIGFT
ncbi:MAG TPA: phosphatidylserine decarboxylase, partial [Novosphingobium sp.]|nr:phosphatidylserine decarboxylase [Novosphingobium sp.]